MLVSKGFHRPTRSPAESCAVVSRRWFFVCFCRTLRIGWCPRERVEILGRIQHSSTAAPPGFQLALGLTPREEAFEFEEVLFIQVPAGHGDKERGDRHQDAIAQGRQDSGRPSSRQGSHVKAGHLENDDQRQVSEHPKVWKVRDGERNKRNEKGARCPSLDNLAP